MPDIINDVLRIRLHDEIDRLIDINLRLSQVGRAQLLRAVRIGKIALVEIHGRDTAAPISELERPTRPVIALVGDDDYSSTGPAGWAASRRLLWWARAGLVHAAADTAASYESAIETAVRRRRFVLIETSSDRATEWSNCLEKRRIEHVVLKPATGPHPLMPRGLVQ